MTAQHPDETGSVPGLTYLPGYLEPQQHDQLTAVIDSLPWLTELERRVQHYGYRYDYRKRRADRSLYLGPLPDWAAALACRLHREGWFDREPDQLIVNEYHPGQGISKHVDCVPCFGGSVVSITLGSTCILEMGHGKTKQKVCLLLHPRSAVILQGDARYRWTHAIPARKSDRWQGQVLPRGRRLSLTFRTVLLEEDAGGGK
jgi:alkylated DNA repair dioxygenase AlkB